MLSAAELEKASALLAAEVSLWERLCSSRHATAAEREVYARNAQIMRGVGDMVRGACRFCGGHHVRVPQDLCESARGEYDRVSELGVALGLE